MLGVIGPVGSGKSTLLNIFLDETIKTGGEGQLTKTWGTPIYPTKIKLAKLEYLI